MVEIIQDNNGYDYGRALADARKHVEYWQEDLLLTVSTSIIDELANQNVNRSELARRMAVSPAYVTKILRGHANLSLESLARVAFALNKRWDCTMTDMAQQFGRRSDFHGTQRPNEESSAPDAELSCASPNLPQSLAANKELALAA